MKFAVGYRPAEEGAEPFSEMLARYRDSVGEVYFPWMDTPTGRSALATRHGYTDWGMQSRLEEELKAIRGLGIRLDLLFNGNCYGRLAMSEQLRNQVASVLEHLEETVGGADIVTTTSPFIAETVKTYFPSVEVRASVNMWLGTVKSMEYLSDLFDSYYVQREYNRDLNRVRELKDWCDGHGKKLCMLANSGCLAYCTGHSFHDNLVAHESEICETVNVKEFQPYTCWRYLKDREHWPSILQNSWVRPEDIHHYEGLVSIVKLATRLHSRPGMVLDAYVRGRFAGNLPDLCEPGFGPALQPYILDNRAIPEDFFEKTSSCDKKCHTCGYCREVLEKALVRMDTETALF